MKFEEWAQRAKELHIGAGELVDLDEILADWKAERVFYLLQNKDFEEANNSMGPKMIKLIGALEKYATHSFSCNLAMRNPSKDTTECTCGLATVWAEVRR